MLGTGNDVLELAEHLASVAHAQRERIAACEERGERVAQRRALQDGCRPAAACTQHVAVAETAARRKAHERAQVHAALDQVAHVHVVGTETGTLEVVGHFDLPVDALLAQDRHLGPRAGGHEWRRDIVGRVEHQLRAQA